MSLTNKILGAENLSVKYTTELVLRGITLDISAGERLLLIGPNGSGKTTLLKAIIGLLRMETGRIYFDSQDVTASSVQSRIRRGISYLLQQRNIVPGLSVEENLTLGGYHLRRGEVEKQKEKVLNSASILKGKLKTRAGLLSGGERQALALGMVLMRNPKLLLLDEPSAGLAPRTASAIIESIEALQESFEVSAICMVEHNLKLALQWASRIILLVQGRIVYTSDSPRTFINKPEELEKFFFS
jgi:ABC-type branched-subunit amino acid transport system ATPase component